MEAINFIQAKGISKAYGENVLFQNISISIDQGQKVALIARNGTGKTTLLNILAGRDEPDDGYCTYRSGLRISYLPQEPSFDPENTVSQALLSADNEQTRAIRAYEEFIQEEEDTNDPEKARQLQYLIERMDALQAWDYEQRVKQILTKLKIGNLKALVGTLSGGEVKRLALGKILIEEADFVILDEPTNHLDISMIEWLESFFNRQKITLLMVTHDRYFLDAICNEIIEIENGNIHSYHGNYAYFLEKKAERKMAEAARSEKVMNLLKKESEWMRRSPPARTTKSKARKQAYNDLQEEARTQEESRMGDIQMDPARLGKKILELRHVHKTFDNKTVVNDFSYVFKGGERVGIVGPNGTGKSTLLNIITGSVKPDEGKVITGQTVQFGYYHQDGITIEHHKKVIEVITDIADRIHLTKDHWMSASQFLRHFNFPNHMHHDRVEKLSGGEKRRLYLLTVLIKNPNFLILDEPTNDLDIDTLNLLEDFLLRYTGCLVIVSHDRYFLDRLSDHLFVFRDVGNIKDFPGNYTDYRIKQQQITTGQRAGSKKEKATKHKKQERSSGEKKRRSYKEQREFEALEQEINSLEEEKATLLDKMNSGTLPPEDLTDASTRFREVEELLESKENRWLELSEFGEN
ncbi:MAG: ABC-F family ATP-binding cassette domain-containing protein [Bacteroidales bacterium]